ncbi:MAG: hypothetical protein IPH31_25410 [Lewinellaceae bacterium]|nr:hypothetical protein [Lewinellaceae bacterium]
MKFLSILSIAALCAISVFSACGGDSAASKDASTETTGDQAPPADPMANFPNPNGAATPPAEPAQNAAGLWHFTCPKGCKGGGGSAVPCATCGTTLTHSQSYHGPAGAPPPGNPAARPQLHRALQVLQVLQVLQRLQCPLLQRTSHHRMQLVYGIIPVLAAAQVAADRLLHAASAAKCWNTTRVTTNKGVTRVVP